MLHPILALHLLEFDAVHTECVFYWTCSAGGCVMPIWSRELLLCVFVQVGSCRSNPMLALLATSVQIVWPTIR